MTDQKTDLLPCPFCDSEADSNLRNTTLESAVGCPCCGAKIEYIGEIGRVEAVAAWNTRADLAPMVKPLEWEKMDETAWIAHGLDQAEYHISTSDGSVWEFSSHYDPEEDPDFTGTENEAKTHVGQLHERRILSALTFAQITPAQAAKVFLNDQDKLYDFAASVMRLNKLKDGKRMGYAPAIKAALKAIAEDGE